MDRRSSQGTIDEEIPESKLQTPVEPKTTRTKDPMAFSSILSSTEPEPSAPAPHATQAAKPLKSSSHMSNGDAKPAAAAPRKSSSKVISSPKDYPIPPKRLVKAEIEPPANKSVANGKLKPGATSDKENEKVKREVAKIDAMELSDIESPEFDAAKQKHSQAAQKRQQTIEDAEGAKRKVMKSAPTLLKLFWLITASVAAL